jgi:multidrug resistance efflux pump
MDRLDVGQAAEVTVDAVEDEVFDGEVVTLAQTAEFTPKNVQTKDERANLVYAVKIRVENPDELLKPGMPADAKIDLD